MALGETKGHSGCQIRGLNFRVCPRKMTPTHQRDWRRVQFMDDEALSRPAAVGEGRGSQVGSCKCEETIRADDGWILMG